MTSIELKEWIYNNEKIESLLEDIGCKNIVYHQAKEYYLCGNYDGDNKTAITVKNNVYISVTNYTRKKDFPEASDIITLTMYNKNLSFPKAIRYIHEFFGFTYTYQKQQPITEKKIDPLAIFKKFAVKKKTVEVETVDESVLLDFTPMIHISWFRDGIMPWTKNKFGIGYSYRWQRVIMPHRYWLDGSLIGFNARTTVENYDEFNISKYFLTPGMNKSINLYGLWEHFDSIQKEGYVVVYEAEKSVLKRDSLLDETGVAISGHSLSEEQIRILIGLNVDIIISMDNDIHIDEIRFMCSKFYHIRNVYYTLDKYNILGSKDSITDKGDKIFQYLMNYKVKYDENEHRAYLKSLENNTNKN